MNVMTTDAGLMSEHALRLRQAARRREEEQVHRVRRTQSSGAGSVSRPTPPRTAVAAGAMRERPATRTPSYLRLVTSPALAPTPPHRHRSVTPTRGWGRVRLTTRGRVVLIALAALIVAGAASAVLAMGAGWLGSSARAADDRGGVSERIVIVVEPGDTLWSIAREVRPGSPAWDTVRELRETNALTDSLITPGQRLVLPVVHPG